MAAWLQASISTMFLAAVVFSQLGVVLGYHVPVVVGSLSGLRPSGLCGSATIGSSMFYV